MPRSSTSRPPRAPRAARPGPASPRDEAFATDLLAPIVPRWEVRALDAAHHQSDGDSDSEVLAVLLGQGEDERTALDSALGHLGVAGESALEIHEPSSAAGSLLTFPIRHQVGTRSRVQSATVVHVVGLGAGRSGDWRAAGAALGRATRGKPRLVLAVGAAGQGETGLVTALAEGVVLGSWMPPRFTAAGPVTPQAPVAQVDLLLGSEATADWVDETTRAIERATERARATLIARCLGVTPSNLKNPAWMAAQARTLARRTGLTVNVWTEKDLAREGFGGLLSVGGGSVSPPRLVQLTWEPPGATADTTHVALVGKGITFDTGGLNLKPADGMLAMKTDMMGAAAVLATLATCRSLGVQVRVTGLLALAENAVSGSSQRPSDVITQFGGTTVEIGNTDAEGRIVLADALAHAARLRPDLLVDIATLTGAARVALARAMAPVYATDDSLRDRLVAAGETTGETLWPLPLATAYRAALDSEVADLKQFSGEHQGGSIMAALFLREFVGDLPWAHLDIAGPGRSDVDSGLLAKGATGFGTRLLLTFLEGLS